jgi:hypothetical protein
MHIADGACVWCSGSWCLLPALLSCAWCDETKLPPRPSPPPLPSSSCGFSARPQRNECRPPPPHIRRQHGSERCAAAAATAALETAVAAQFIAQIQYKIRGLRASNQGGLSHVTSRSKAPAHPPKGPKPAALAETPLELAQKTCSTTEQNKRGSPRRGNQKSVEFQDMIPPAHPQVPQQTGLPR